MRIGTRNNRIRPLISHVSIRRIESQTIEFYPHLLGHAYVHNNSRITRSRMFR